MCGAARCSWHYNERNQTSQNSRRQIRCCRLEHWSHPVPNAPKQLNTELPGKKDRWGQEFISRLLAMCLDCLPALDISKSSALCSAWRLARNLEDRLFQSRYASDFELETSNR